jgi:asparagine synthetase B (glutamine-hydrolysing)
MPNAILGRQRHGIDVSVETVASVLHLRGPFTPQPLADEKGNVLLWNAEIFGGLEIEEHANDTRLLLNKLKECSDHTDIADFMSRIYGPWSFIYYQVKNQLLWFGRDFFGRRSLLWHLPHHALDSFSLSSVATKTGKQTDWAEIPTGVYCLSLSSVVSGQLHITCYSWSYEEGINNQHEQHFAELSLTHQQCVVFTQSPISLSPPLKPFNCCLSARVITPCSGKHVGTPIVCSQTEEGLLHSVVKTRLAETLLHLLENAVSKRVRNIPQLSDIQTVVRKSESEPVDGSHLNCHVSTSENARVGVLFSGGVDSIVLAALADRCLNNDEEIDLLNVAFEQIVPPCSSQYATKRIVQESSGDSIVSFDVPDRLTGLSGVEELKKLNYARKWNFVQV